MNSNQSKMSCKQGFTLIELLVVVLIIGILAAVAVPQYQKTIERSKATEAMSMLSAIAKAGQVYYLANGVPATKFEQLEIDIPFSEDTAFVNGSSVTDTTSNKDWSFQIQSNRGIFIFYAGRIFGKYKGAGFFYRLDAESKNKEIRCIERLIGSNFIFDENLGEGAYCERVMQAQKVSEDEWARYYQLP